MKIRIRGARPKVYAVYQMRREFAQNIRKFYSTRACAKLRLAAADLEGFAHSAAAQLENAYEVPEPHVLHMCLGNTQS